jgi:hypothetical protein
MNQSVVAPVNLFVTKRLLEDHETCCDTCLTFVNSFLSAFRVASLALTFERSAALRTPLEFFHPLSAESAVCHPAIYWLLDLFFQFYEFPIFAPTDIDKLEIGWNRERSAQ